MLKNDVFYRSNLSGRIDRHDRQGYNKKKRKRYREKNVYLFILFPKARKYKEKGTMYDFDRIRIPTAICDSHGTVVGKNKPAGRLKWLRKGGSLLMNADKQTGEKYLSVFSGNVSRILLTVSPAPRGNLISTAFIVRGEEIPGIGQTAYWFFFPQIQPAAGFPVLPDEDPVLFDCLSRAADALLSSCKEDSSLSVSDYADYILSAARFIVSAFAPDFGIKERERLPVIGETLCGCASSFCRDSGITLNCESTSLVESDLRGLRLSSDETERLLALFILMLGFSADISCTAAVSVRLTAKDDHFYITMSTECPVDNSDSILNKMDQPSGEIRFKAIENDRQIRKMLMPEWKSVSGFVLAPSLAPGLIRYTAKLSLSLRTASAESLKAALPAVPFITAAAFARAVSVIASVLPERAAGTVPDPEDFIVRTDIFPIE